MSNPERYWRGSIRISELRVAYCRREAARQGWALSDLVRSLIFLGATTTFLGLENPELSERFKLLATFSWSSEQLDMALSGHHGRRKQPRGLAETVSVRVRLPRGFFKILADYADTSGRSRNETLDMSLERGFLFHIRGLKALLETIRSLQEEREASAPGTSA